LSTPRISSNDLQAIAEPAASASAVIAPTAPPVSIVLAPSNRWLYAGFGVALIGIIVLLVISILDTSSDEVSAPDPVAPVTASAPVLPAFTVSTPTASSAAAPAVAASTAARPAPSTTTSPVAASTAAPPAPDPAPSITIRVSSTPPGADVLLAGTPIGTTPLEIHVKRKPGLATLTVHRARFNDVSSTVDLGADYTTDVKLVAIADEPAKPPSRPPRPATSRDTRPRVPPAQPPARKCQPPGRFNPFDTSCDGKPCPPCR